MGKFSDFVVKNPVMVLVAFTVISAIVSSGALNIKIVSNLDDYLPQSDPTVQTLNDIRTDWSIDMVIVYIETDGATKAANLNEIYRIEKKINNELGGVDYTISLASVIAGTSSRLTGQDSVPSQQQIVDLYLSQIPDSMRYKLVSKDGKDAIMLVSVLPSADQAKMVEKLGGIISQSSGIMMYATGPVAMAQEGVSWTIRQMAPVTLLSLGCVCAMLFIFHRNIKIVIIAGAPVVYSIALTAGMLGLLQIKFTPNVIAVGCVLVAMGIAYGLYMANRYAEELGRMAPVDAATRAMSTTGKAIFLSAITTMVGFAALMIAPMPPIFSMGFALTMGIFFCYVSTIVVVPCLLVLLKYKKRRRPAEWARLAKLTQHPKKIAIVILAITAASLLCIPNVSMEVDLMGMAPGGIPSVEKMETYSEKFGAGQPSFFAVSGDILDPGVLSSMDSLQQKINSIDGVSCYSIVDLFKKLNGGYIPQTRLQAQLMLNTMLGEREQRMMLADGNGRALVFVDMPMAPLDETERMVSEVRAAMAQSPVAGCKTTDVTGIGPVLVSIHASMMRSQTSSTIAAFAAVLVCMVPVFLSARYSVLTMLPVSITLLWQPLILVGLGVPLTIITVTISSIVIGSGVDFAIQITQRVIDERKAGAGGLEAVFEAITKVGPSLLEATATVSAGLLAAMIIDYPTMREFILVVILMLACACAMAVLILPAIYSIRYGKWIESWTSIEIKLPAAEISKMAADASGRAREYVSTHISRLHIRSLSEWLESRRNR